MGLRMGIPSRCPLLKECTFAVVHMIREWWGATNIPCYNYRYFDCPIYRKCIEYEGVKRKLCLMREYEETKKAFYKVIG